MEFRFGYTGREHDEETGLIYYRTRYYNPETGRFLSEDTIGFAGGDANLYRYVENSPHNFTDPYGESPFDVARNLADRARAQVEQKASELLRAIAYNKAASGAIEGADRFFAGLAAGATGDLSNALREKLYGEQAVGNQSGLEYWAGYAIGTGLGAAVGSGATRLVSLYNRIMDAIGTAQSIYEVVTSVADVLTNCDDPQEVLSELFQLARQRLQDALFERVLGDLGGRRLGIGPSPGGTPARPPAGAGGGPPLGVTGGRGTPAPPGITGNIPPPPTPSTTPISMDEALDLGDQFLIPGVPTRTVERSSGIQIIQVTTDSHGRTVARRVGFDVNPNSGHVQQEGPHLNLQTRINRRDQEGNLADPHIPIDPNTVRPGDF